MNSAALGGKVLNSSLAVCALLVVVVLGGCGNADGYNKAASGPAASASDAHVLSLGEAKKALARLPYRYSYRQVSLPSGAVAATAGKVRGPKKTSFQFSIALGEEARAVPLPISGSENAVGVSPAGLVFNTNLLVKDKNGKFHPGPSIHNKAQWDESGHMEVSMEEALCRAATHEPCPV